MAMLTDKNLIGASGEHLVLSRLLERGILASQAPRGARKADVLVNPLDGGRPILIQVKATLDTGSRLKWHMKSKHELIADKDMFYCFVGLGDADSDIYIIPAAKVAKVVRDSHSTWLKTPGAKGQKHNDTDMRRIKNRYNMKISSAPDGWMDKYLEDWEQLTK